MRLPIIVKSENICAPPGRCGFQPHLPRCKGNYGFHYKHSAPTREDGFTLVEILVTLAILAAVLPALLNAFASAARNQALSDNSTTALYLLKFQMAQIEMEGFPDAGEASGEFGENSRYSWNSIIEDIESEEIENVRRVQVTVTWIHKSRERSMSMTTFIADRQKSQTQQGQQQGGGR